MNSDICVKSFQNICSFQRIIVYIQYTWLSKVIISLYGLYPAKITAVNNIKCKIIPVIVLPQVLSTTKLVLITSCIDQNLSTIRSAVANYLHLLTHCSLNILIISLTCGWSYNEMHMAFGSACIWRRVPI